MMKVLDNKFNDALFVMREAAQWLTDTGQSLWTTDDLSEERILEGVSKENFIVGYINKEPAAAMILQWADKPLWPDIEENESGFIHKLSVRKKFKGLNLSSELIKYAERICLDNGIHFLRLDCAADRPKLRNLYESEGFQYVGEKVFGPYTAAFYEKRINQMKYIVIKEYTDAPLSPITIKKGEILDFIEESDPAGDWPNWVFCKGEGKEGWIPKQILEINESKATSIDDYTAKEHNLEKGEILVSIKELNGWIWGYKETEPDLLGWAPLNHLEIKKA